MPIHHDAFGDPLVTTVTPQLSYRAPFRLGIELEQHTKEELIGTISFYHYNLCKPREITCSWEGFQYSPNIDEMRNMSHEKLLLQLKEYKKLDKTIKETPPIDPRIVNQRRREAEKERTKIAIEKHPHLDAFLFGP